MTSTPPSFEARATRGQQSVISAAQNRGVTVSASPNTFPELHWREEGRRPNKATAENRSLARKHGPDVIAELARLAKEVQSEQARISRNVLIDRAYGRAQASQLIEIELPDVSKIDGVTTENPKQLDRGVGCSDPRAASFNPENRPKDQSQQKDRYDKRDHSNLL